VSAGLASALHGGYPQKTLTAGNVYRALWRHKFLIVVLTALFVGATLYGTSKQTRIYEGSALVRLQEGGNTGNASAALLAAQTLTQTYAKIIGSGALKGEIRTLVAACSRGSSASTRAQRAGPTPGAGAASSGTVQRPPAGACKTLGSTKRVGPREVSEVELSGSPVQDLDLLTITARSKNPTNAVVAANAVPWVLRTFIHKSGSNEKIITIKAATMPSSPVSRQLPLKIAIAVMIGLIFNGALALFLELFRDRLPEPDELGRALGHPVLATIPPLRLHPVPSVAAREESGSILAVERSSDDNGESRATARRVGGPGS
jgi:capsular polysaccharide biosynthesis protein